MKIVFLGTPDFSVPALDLLLTYGYDIVGVITSVDSYGGRGKKQLIESPVKKYAVSKGLRVLQPKNLKSKSFQKELASLKADLQIVIAFRMLPEKVWNMPRLGTYNIHGSLLPKFRGAAPINWAIIAGEKETGVTSFKLKHEIDTGDMLFHESMPIYHSDTASEVHDRMMYLGAETILKTVQAIEKGEYNLKVQDESQISKAPKLFAENCRITFDKTVIKLFHFIRGLSPYPGAWTTLDGKKLKIFWADYETDSNDVDPIGTFTSDGKTFLKLKVKDGCLDIQDLQLAGKRRMQTKEFLNGFQFSEDSQVILK